MEILNVVRISILSISFVYSYNFHLLFIENYFFKDAGRVDYIMILAKKTILLYANKSFLCLVLTIVNKKDMLMLQKYRNIP